MQKIRMIAVAILALGAMLSNAQTTIIKTTAPSVVAEGKSIIYAKNTLGRDTIYVVPTDSIHQLVPGCPCRTFYDEAVKKMTAKDGSEVRYTERTLQSKATGKTVGTRRFAVFVGKEKPKGEVPVEEIRSIDNKIVLD